MCETTFFAFFNIGEGWDKKYFYSRLKSFGGGNISIFPGTIFTTLFHFCVCVLEGGGGGLKVILL